MNVSKVIGNSNLSPKSYNRELKNAYQCHLSTTHVVSSSTESQCKANDDLPSRLYIESDKLNSPIAQLNPSKTPKRSNFEKLRSVFDEEMKGDVKNGLGNPGKSPGLMKLLQQNERKLSEKLESKKEKDSVKKLKKKEKEAKIERSNTEKKKFRDIQLMFDELSKKKDQSEAKNTPIRRLVYKGGKEIGPKVDSLSTSNLDKKLPSLSKKLLEDTVKIVNRRST